MSWRIQKVEGSDTTDLGALPTHMSVAEVETALQRLVCTRLTEHEIIAASLRREMGGYSRLLERDGGLVPIVFEHGNVRYVATRES